MSNASPTRPAEPADLAPIETAYLRAPRVPDLATLLAEWGDFSDGETADVLNRAQKLVAGGCSPAGAVEEAVYELQHAGIW